MLWDHKLEWARLVLALSLAYADTSQLEMAPAHLH